jgi:hypothetical protein
MPYLGRCRRSGGKLVRVLVADPTASFDARLCREQFDRVIDLGVSGQARRESLKEPLHCQIEPAQKLDTTDFARIRELFSAGLGQVVDEHGVDWWELASMEFHQQLEMLMTLKKIALEIEECDELFVTRPGIHADALGLILKRPVGILHPRHALGARFRHYARVFRKFSLHELLQIAADKYDAGYRLRRFVAQRNKRCACPVVLLPSAYVNASRTVLRYADMLPESNFLLVTTRSSGRTAVRPDNVEMANLSSYASGNSGRLEFQVLLRKFTTLINGLMGFEEFAILDRLGSFNRIPKFLQDGLAVRNAWLKVFEKEPVSAVLCGDEALAFTCLPVLIARYRGLPTVACHHGALDGRYRFMRVRADVFLAKGRMEHEYTVRNCGVEAVKVKIGAPLVNVRTTSARPKRFIVFFSEPYEIVGGRCSEFYKEILPRLAGIASATGHELVVKLHPFESRRERVRLINAALSERERDVTRVVAGPLSDELLEEAWCAVTVLSTTAVDCTLRGIPVFLCEWLDCSQYGYSQQFAKFGAGTALNSPNDIRQIPALIKNFKPTNITDLCNPITAEDLEELLSGSVVMAEAV